MKWCISGSRDWIDYPSFEKQMEKVVTELKGMPEFIHVGDCHGTDAMCITWCKEHQVPYEIHEAKWAELGNKAGPIRNRQMIERSDVLIAFPSEFSKGTTGAINIARKMGKKIITFQLRFNFDAKINIKLN